MQHALMIVDSDSSCLQHWISGIDDYATAVVVEADDRANIIVRGVEDYLALRIDTAGPRATLAIIEFGLNLPDEILQSPIIAALTESASVLIAVINVCLFFL